ncbi:amino acid permease-domain-containing protein [Apiosordaria backusii]|uniref:Amino acid permease-domain-containing protein n=1 Tax=Apiosordaria backusii TaxID=314023 RepID=A0AA40B2B8_9PEZI|nr:amino acid permease-domain-containing protein [Apiosordaria backusii]
MTASTPNLKPGYGTVSSSSSGSSTPQPPPSLKKDIAPIKIVNHADLESPLASPQATNPLLSTPQNLAQEHQIESRSLQKGLSQRHLSMLGIAGSIGTGLFLGLGGAVATGGPLGALLGYAVIGLVVCSVQFALGEVAALMPVTGSFVRHSEVLVDPAMGFAIGWNLVYGNLLSIPSEIVAVCVLIKFWTGDSLNPAAVILPFIALTGGVGMAFVRVFGEVEFVFAMLKILLVVFLIVLGLVINLGGVPGTEVIGFRYWQDPGPFVEYIAQGDWGKFLGFWAVMTGAVFSFAGVESLAMAAAETRNPREAIPRAVKRVFARIVIFYGLAVFVVGLLVPSNDERLKGSGDTVAQSPFVIAAAAAGIKGIPSLVNAIVITSAWSAANQSLLAGTRVLYGLALKGQAPKLFLRTTSWGTPYMCVLLFTAFMFLSFLSLSKNAMSVFWWLVMLTAAGVLVSWSSILLNHIRLLKAMKKQGISTDRLPWHNWWTEYTSPAGLFMCIVILFTSGFSVFTKGHWDSAKFVSSYLDVPIVLTAYFLWKLLRKTSIVPLDQIPLEEAFEHAEENLAIQNQSFQPTKKTKSWTRFVSWIWD